MYLLLFSFFGVIQDAASKLSPGQAITTLQAAEAKYKTALISAQGHPEASYNLATCLSEQADVRGDLVGAEAAAGEQVRLDYQSSITLSAPFSARGCVRKIQMVSAQ